MSNTALFRMIVEFEVTDVEGFKELVAEASAISRSEPGTLVYDWYLDADAGRARLHEAYDSFESLDAHTSGRVFTELGPRFVDVARFVHIDFYGEIPPERQHDEPLAPRTVWGARFASADDQSLDG
jgi:quinol monooxygenase YgiN